jgi:hypothetical protein
VSGTGGLPIGLACISVRTVISPTQFRVLVCELASSRRHLLSSRARIQVDGEGGRRVMGCMQL